jgi:ferredoxin
MALFTDLLIDNKPDLSSYLYFYNPLAFNYFNSVTFITRYKIMTMTYKIQLMNEEEGINQTVNVPEDEYILETAENEGMELPYSCRQGVCSTCTGKLVEGSVDQSEQSYLTDDRIAEDYVLICIAHPTSDCRIITHKEEEVA